MHFPENSIAAIRDMGMRQMNPETLRWTANHPNSSYGIGVILRGKSGLVLDGKTFEGLHKAFGAWIEVDSEETKRKVQNSLVTAVTQLDDQIKVVEVKPVGRPKKMDAGRNRTIYLSQTSADMAEKIGNGNMSEGIRIALEAYGK